MKKVVAFTLMCAMSLFTIGCGPTDDDTAAPITPPATEDAGSTEGGSAE
ncbi:hypothetical protein Pla110_07550 [Polystyrenella longa]|uniref:Uncharacterized protein n=1 Tax=Polystyrenella longa TaxID=2528007 RepID=A0A518CIK1_9PLAN|nr:hypothetical protein [Polystyrenella longa]QDU79051.1 hypothetical protein Pla110_07550 [Polystyrenella longa]